MVYKIKGNVNGIGSRRVTKNEKNPQYLLFRKRYFAAGGIKRDRGGGVSLNNETRAITFLPSSNNNWKTSTPQLM